MIRFRLDIGASESSVAASKYRDERRLDQMLLIRRFAARCACGATGALISNAGEQVKSIVHGKRRGQASR
jgi:hypothetical protein